MENLNGVCKSEKNLNNDGLLSVIVNQERPIDNISKKIVASNSISKLPRRSLKPAGTRPGVKYGLHKNIVNKCPPFRTVCQQLILLLKN